MLITRDEVDDFATRIRAALLDGVLPSRGGSRAIRRVRAFHLAAMRRALAALRDLETRKEPTP